MTKQELLKLLKETLNTEESAMPLYTRHIDSTLFLSGFDSGEQKHISRILNTLNAESTDHGIALRQLINKIESEDKDVY